MLNFNSVNQSISQSIKGIVIAGYDIRSEKGYEQMKAEFEEVVGRHYLKAVHLNDSKGNWIVVILSWNLWSVVDKR